MENQPRARQPAGRNSIGMVICAVTGVATLLTTPANAQFPGGLGGLMPGAKPPAANGQVVMSPADVEAHYGELNVRFFHALREMLAAQSYTLAALGDKGKADELSAEASSLEGKSDLNTVSRSITISQDASTEINDKMSTAGMMNAESKAVLVQAIPHYAKGMVEALQLPHAYQLWLSGAQQTANGMQGNPMQAMRLPRLLMEIRDVTGVTVHLPDLIGTWSNTTGNFVKFAHNNNVDTTDLSAKI
jgi:hypothetical protein